MNTPKSTKLALTCFLLAGTLGVSLFNANAAALTWTGLSGTTNGWSDTNNWSPAQLPANGDTLAFGDGGSTNVIGALNNTVDADYTLTRLTYSALFTNLVTTNFHGTAISQGTTLTVNSANSSFFYVGTGLDDGKDSTNFTTIVGSGRLVLGNPAAPSTNANSNVQIKQTSVTSGNHRAVLDLSGLDNFVFAAGKFVVAGDGTFGGAGDRPQGMVLLARTNVITCAAPRITDPSAVVSQPFTIGYSQGSQSATTTTNLVQLGQENTINSDYIKIGGLKLIGQVSFRPGLVNPTLKLRGAYGTNRVPQLVLGDHGEARIVSFVSRGNLDLSPGTVDAMVEDMYLGKNGWRDNATDTGSASGTMTIAAGTFDVKNLNIGCQQGDNLGNATGTVTVRTNATLLAGNINIGRDSGAATGKGTGSLIINAGVVNVSGNVAEIDGIGGAGISTLVITNNGTLNMMPPDDTVPGNVIVRNFNSGNGTLTNYAILGTTNLTLVDGVTNFTVYSGQALAPFAVGVPGPLTVKGSLTLANARLRLDLNNPADASSNDQIAVSNILTLGGANIVDIGGTIMPGTYTLMTYGTLVGDTNNLQVTGALANSRYSFSFDTATVPSVNLTVSGGPTRSLTWAGDGTANAWDLRTTSNWNGHAEKYFDLDAATFDDTGSVTPAVNLTGTLQPASVTVNSSNHYTFSSSGKLSGAGGLVNNGSGKLTILTANDYTGDTTINAGTVVINGALGNTTVSVNSGATLGGTGTILGPVTVQSGGMFTPGTSIGTMAISNNLVLSDGSTNTFEANLDTLTHDKVIGLHTVTYGGTLNLVLSGRAVNGNDTFKLFSATTVANAFSSPYSGAFTAIVPETPGAYLAWDTSTLATDGTLRVVDTRPRVTVQVSGNQLTLSWPAANVGWRLQSQTNGINVGLSTNWFDVPGSTNTDNATLDIDPGNGTVFYRLGSP